MDPMPNLVSSAMEEDFDVSTLPPGFRFHPTDQEIITHYLSKKATNNSFISIAIGEADFNKCEPWDLPKMAKMGEREWYFFCRRDRKYPTGVRTNRATGSGYWKATGKDKGIVDGKRNAIAIGMKKTLVFYIGRAPRGEKTNWVMHEYRLLHSSKDDWVICKVIQKEPAPTRKVQVQLPQNASLCFEESPSSAACFLRQQMPTSVNYDYTPSLGNGGRHDDVGVTLGGGGLDLAAEWFEENRSMDTGLTGDTGGEISSVTASNVDSWAQVDDQLLLGQMADLDCLWNY